MTECCDNCRFCRAFLDISYCHRRAPATYDFLRLYELELLRDIAWTLRVIAGTAGEIKKYDDIATLATEAMSDALWTVVDRDDWCGEWEERR